MENKGGKLPLGCIDHQCKWLVKLIKNYWIEIKCGMIVLVNEIVRVWVEQFVQKIRNKSKIIEMRHKKNWIWIEKESVRMVGFVAQWVLLLRHSEERNSWSMMRKMYITNISEKKSKNWWKFGFNWIYGNDEISDWKYKPMSNQWKISKHKICQLKIKNYDEMKN